MTDDSLDDAQLEDALRALRHDRAHVPAPSAELLQRGRRRQRRRRTTAVVVVAAAALVVVGGMSLSGGGGGSTAPHVADTASATPTATASSAPVPAPETPSGRDLAMAFKSCAPFGSPPVGSTPQVGSASGEYSMVVMLSPDGRILVCDQEHGLGGSRIAPDKVQAAANAGPAYFVMRSHTKCDDVSYGSTGHLDHVESLVYTFPDGHQERADVNAAGYWAVMYHPDTPFPPTSDIEVTVDGRDLTTSIVNGGAGC